MTIASTSSSTTSSVPVDGREASGARHLMKDTIRCNQMQSDAIRCSQMQSDTLRGNRDAAIRGYQRHREHGTRRDTRPAPVALPMPAETRIAPRSVAAVTLGGTRRLAVLAFWSSSLCASRWAALADGAVEAFPDAVAPRPSAPPLHLATALMSAPMSAPMMAIPSELMACNRCCARLVASIAPLLLVVAPPPWHAPELLMLGAFLALGFSGGGSTAESEEWLKIATRRAGCSADSSC